jgi:hypothetical protein
MCRVVRRKTSEAIDPRFQKIMWLVTCVCVNHKLVFYYFDFFGSFSTS